MHFCRGPRTAVTCSTGPSVGSKRASACGPMSHSAPRSLRHGDSPNGLPGSKIEESIVTLPPFQSWPSTAVSNQLRRRGRSVG